MKADQSTRHMLYTLLIFAVAIAVFSYISRYTLDGESARIQRWDAAILDDATQNNPIRRRLDDERYYFEGDVHTSMDGMELRRAISIFNIETRNHLRVVAANPPPNWYATPTDFTAVTMDAQITINTGKFQQRAASWSLLPVERGRYALCPLMWPSMSLDAATASYVSIDRTILYETKQLPTNLFEFMATGSQGVYYIRRARTQTYLREIDGRPAWGAFNQAGRFVVRPNGYVNQVNYWVPKISVERQMLWSALELQNMLDSLETKNVGVDKNGVVTVDSKNTACYVGIRENGKLMSDDGNWQYLTYQLQIIGQPNVLAVSGGVSLTRQCSGLTNQEISIHIVPKLSVVGENEFTSSLKDNNAFNQNEKVVNQKTIDIQTISGNFIIVRAFPYDLEENAPNEFNLTNKYYMSRRKYHESGTYVESGNCSFGNTHHPYPNSVQNCVPNYPFTMTSKSPEVGAGDFGRKFNPLLSYQLATMEETVGTFPGTFEEARGSYLQIYPASVIVYPQSQGMQLDQNFDDYPTFNCDYPLTAWASTITNMPSVPFLRSGQIVFNDFTQQFTWKTYNYGLYSINYEGYTANSQLVFEFE